MPTSEYMGWIAYYEEKERKAQVDKGNIMAMNETELSKAFPRGS